MFASKIKQRQATVGREAFFKSKSSIFGFFEVESSKGREAVFKAKSKRDRL